MPRINTAVDLFAGCGGSTQGAQDAGVQVLVAANHWLAAIDTHKANHPDTHHLCQDLCQANFHDWPNFDLLMASPACQGHSSARGAERTHHDNCRSTAWAVVACAEAKKPRALMVENVVDFRRWTLYAEWRRCLEKLGYILHENILNSADFGVPQSRIRLFVTGVHRSHSTTPVVVNSPCAQSRPASTIIDWTAGKWSSVSTKAEATIKRWENGRLKHGQRFLLAYFGKEKGGRSLDNPLGTVLTRDRFALVDGSRMRMLGIQEYRQAMGFPDGFRLPPSHKTALHLLGNAVVPAVARAVVSAFSSN